MGFPAVVCSETVPTPLHAPLPHGERALASDGSYDSWNGKVPSPAMRIWIATPIPCWLKFSGQSVLPVHGSCIHSCSAPLASLIACDLVGRVSFSLLGPSLVSLAGPRCESRDKRLLWRHRGERRACLHSFLGLGLSDSVSSVGRVLVESFLRPVQLVESHALLVHRLPWY